MEEEFNRLSYEENQAISQCKLLLNGDISLHVIDENDGGTAYYGVVNKLYNKDLEIVLNLIEKQQKKIEELKQKYLLLNQVTDIEKSQYRRSTKELLKELNENYIPKSKVREKIEELKEFQDRYEKCNNLKDVAIKQEEINLLNKLLQEGDK